MTAVILKGKRESLRAILVLVPNQLRGHTTLLSAPDEFLLQAFYASSRITTSSGCFKS